MSTERTIIAPGARGATIFAEALRERGLGLVVPESWSHTVFQRQFKKEIAELPQQPCEAANEMASLKVKSVLLLPEFGEADLDVVAFHSIALSMFGQPISNFRNRKEFRAEISRLMGNSFTYYVALAYGRVRNGKLLKISTSSRSTGLSVKYSSSAELKEIMRGMNDADAVEASVGFRPLTNVYASKCIALVADSREYFFGNVEVAINECLSQ